MIPETYLQGVGVTWSEVEVRAAVLQRKAAAFWYSCSIIKIMNPREKSLHIPPVPNPA